MSDALLAPGWTTYRERLLHETHDVSDLLVPGPNVIAATLGDGWYRGRLGWDPGEDRCNYGEQLALLAQLEVELADGSRLVIVTDGDWQASTGEVLMADLYDGCTIDLRARQPGWDRVGFATDGWRDVCVVPLDPCIVTPRVAPPVRRIAELAPTLTTRPDGVLQLDGGQNISGFVRLRVRGEAGDRVVVRHAEVLEPDGSLHTRSLRSARATDTYICKGGGESKRGEPRFTFHGFRYAEVGPPPSSTRPAWPSASTPAGGGFDCSDAPQPTPLEHPLGPARQFHLRPHRLPAARRAPRLDRRRPGLRRHRELRSWTPPRSGRAGCADLAR